MWSVVTLSPSRASTRAPSMSSTGAGSAAPRSKNGASKNGGFSTYVESPAQANVSPSAIVTDRHSSSPSKTDA